MSGRLTGQELNSCNRSAFCRQAKAAQPRPARLAVDERRASAISEDGSRVVWHTEGIGAGKRLYMRDVRGEGTVELDVAEPGCVLEQKCVSGGGKFQVASSDGSRVFFTDEQRLTSDAGAAKNEPDLYECEMIEEAGGLRCVLSDLTPSSGGEHADVQGAVLGASKDGSWVYFVVDGVLAAGAQRDEPNLYVRHGGATRLVAVLSANDSPDWGSASGEAGNLEDAAFLSARVSPNGRWLAFMSQRPLTSYDPRDAFSGRPDEEVYLYDGESGRVVCASCNPTGGRPVGTVFGPGAGAAEEGFLGGNRAWSGTGTWVAGLVPGWSLPQYQSRYLSDGGRLFFDSHDGLVSQDVDGTWDVYEYEPSGVGGCGVSSGTFVGVSGGCVGLVSSGASPEPSAFLDASVSGGDVFFLTSAKLLSQDFDTSRDLYDAHECSSVSPCQPVPAAFPPSCSTGDSCKPASSPQPEIFGAPSSATFSGPGNVVPSKSKPVVKTTKSLTRAQKLSKALRACRKKPKRKRVVCERGARRAYGAVRKSAVSRGRGK